MNFELEIDLPDPTAEPRGFARLGVGRAGPRNRTLPHVLFAADHAITQDSLYREVDAALLDEFDLFAVQSRATSREEYLLRPDLGRAFSDEARQRIREQCVHAPVVQIVVADGLSADAIHHNLRRLLPALATALATRGLRLGTPFFVKYARVGLMNEVNALLDAKVVITLIGERPGLGRAESLSAYLGYRPGPTSTDADRDVICNIFDGGLAPLDAASQIAELAALMVKHHASGIALKRLLSVGSAPRA